MGRLKIPKELLTIENCVVNADITSEGKFLAGGFDPVLLVGIMR